MDWNVFRWAGDVSHCLSKIIITLAIHRNRSAEGVSWITQVLYTLVFLSRYTDIFRDTIAWNRILKWFYILSSIYIVFIMRFWFPRTREREIAWKLGGAILAGALLLSPFTLILPHHVSTSFATWLWDFSQILESVCVLPQLLLLRQTTVPTVINSFYLVALGSYRALYLLNWVVRYADDTDRGPEVVSVIFGIVQTALYVDFGWVYWTRQRVKLRNGGIVDADDLSRGWLVNTVLGRAAEPVTLDDEESAPVLGGDRSGGDRSGGGNRNNKWGTRGISVSADDGVLGAEHDDQEEGLVAGPVDPDARMQDPEELARALNESSSDDDDDDDDDDDSDDSEEDDSDDAEEDGKAKAKTPAGGVDGGTSAWRS